MKNSYTLQELLESKSFQAYVKRTDAEAVKIWTEWALSHPEQKEVIEQVRQMIEGVSFQKNQLDESEIGWAWEQVQAQILEAEKPSTQRKLPYYYHVAASVSLLILGAVFWWVFSGSYQMHIQTAFGETKSLKLSDGSEVTINANSSLTFDVRDLSGTERVVALKGEAYFHVIPQVIGDIKSSFSVHTEEGGTIEVLGTSFNVQSRRDITKVVLESGKVAFRTEEDATMMAPGEMIEYSKTTRQVSKKNVQAEKYSAWKDQKLVFDDTPLADLANVLQDTYGLQVVFEDEALKNMKISGNITAANLNTLLQALERLFKIHISREDNTLFFDTNEP